MASAETTLKQFGFTLDEHRRLNLLNSFARQQELRQGLEAYANEVLADRPVSILYHYWFDEKNNLYTNPTLEKIYEAGSQIDPRERDSLPVIGFKRMAQLLKGSQTNEVVLWYSPPGPATFTDDPQNPYSQIDNYNYGQLYLQYFDGIKVNALAIKITNEPVLGQFSQLLSEGLRIPQEKARVANFLIHPVATGEKIFDFLAKDWLDVEIYQDKMDQKHFLPQVIEEVRRVLSGRKDSIVDVDKIISNIYQEQKITPEFLGNIYLSTIRQYLGLIGQNQIRLSGSCGGSSVKFGVEDIFNIKDFITRDPLAELANIYSSFYRATSQGGQKWAYHEGTCRECGKDSSQVGPCQICSDCEKTKFQ